MGARRVATSVLILSQHAPSPRRPKERAPLARIRDRVPNLLVEALYTTTEVSTGTSVERSETLTVNPGARAAIDFASGLQVVPSVSVPIGLGPARGQSAVFSI